MKLARPLDLFIVAMVMASSVYALINLKSHTGSTAEVFVEERKVAVFQLNTEMQIKHIDTPIGEMHIQYGGGSIQIMRSPCPQKICLLQGAIQKTHEQIICVPAQLYVRIINPQESSGDGSIDAVSY